MPQKPLLTLDEWEKLYGMQQEPQPDQEEATHVRTPRPGLLPHAGALATRLLSGFGSGIVGAVPSPFTTPAAAAIGGGGELLAQEMESADPFDYKTAGLESVLSAVPMSGVIKGLHAGGNVAKQVLANVARNAGLVEAGNMLRRKLGGESLLPDTKEKLLTDLGTSAVGGGFGYLGSHFINPKVEAELARLEALEASKTTNDATAKLANTVAAHINTPAAGVAEPAPRLVRPGEDSGVYAGGSDTSAPIIQKTGLRVGSSKPVTLSATAEQVAEHNNGIGTFNAEDTGEPIPAGIAEQQAAISRRPNKVNAEQIDSTGKVRRGPAVKQVLDEEIKKAADVAGVQRRAARVESAEMRRLKAAEDRANLENTRNEMGATDLASIKAEEERAAQTALKERVAAEKAHAQAAEMLAKEELEAAAKLRIEREKEGLVASPPRITETVTAPSADGIETLRRTFAEPPPPEGEGEAATPATPVPPVLKVVKGKRSAAPIKPVPPPSTPPEEPPAAPVLAKPEPTPKAPSGGAAATPEAPKPPAPKAKTPLEFTRAEVNAVTREDVKSWSPDHLYAMRKKYPRDRRLQAIIQGELDGRAATAQKAPEAPVATDKGEVAGQTPEVLKTAPSAPEAPSTHPNDPIGARYITAGMTDDGKVVLAAHKSEGGAMAHYNGMKNSGGRYKRIGSARVSANTKITDIVAKTAKQFGVKPENVSFLPAADKMLAGEKQVEKLNETANKLGREADAAKSQAAHTPKPGTAEAQGFKVEGAINSKPTPEAPAAPIEEAKPEKALLDKSQNEPAAPVKPVSKITNEVKPEAPAQDISAMHPKGSTVHAYNSEGTVLTHGPSGVRVKFTKGRMVQEQGPKGYFDVDPKHINTTVVPEAPKAAPKYTDADIAAEVKGWDETELRRVIAKEKVSDPIRKAVINELNERLKAKTATPANPNKGFEGPDRESSTPAEPAKAAEEAKPASAHDALPEGYVVGNSYAYSKDGAEVAKRELERHGYTDVIIRARKHGDNYEVIGKPPKAKVGKLEKSTPVDLSGAKSAGDVKRRVVQSLKNELNGVEHTTNIEEENGNIKIDGETVARVSKGRRGNPHDLNFVEHIKAAAGKGELPTIGGDGTYGEAVEEAVRAVRGWSLKRGGAPMVEVTLPNGFSLKIPKDKTLLQAAIKRIESGDETAWSGIVDKSVKAEDPNGPIKWPWGAPGSKSRLTAEEATSGGYANKSEITSQLEVLAHAHKQGTDAKAVTIRLPNGFEMTVEPHQAAATLDRIEKTPLSMWEDAEARPISVQIDTKYGTNFNAKNDSPAPGYKVPLKGLDKPFNPEPEPPTVPTGGEAKPTTPKSGLRVGKSGGLDDARVVDAPPLPTKEDVRAAIKTQASQRPTPGPTEGVAEAPSSGMASDKGKKPKGAAPIAKKSNVPTTKDGSTKADLLARHDLPANMKSDDIALKRQEAADAYFELKKQYAADNDPNTYLKLRAAGQKFGELNSATLLAANEEGVKAPELPPAPAKAAKPAGKGPTNEELAKLSPAEQQAKLQKIVDDFKKKVKKEKGAAINDLLLHLGMGTAGALAGSFVDQKDPVTGALLGGATGLFGPVVFRVLQKHIGELPEHIAGQSRKELGHWAWDMLRSAKEIFPDYFRFSLLAKPDNLFMNAVVGPYGSGFWYAFERAMGGDERGVTALQKFTNLYKFGKGIHDAGAEARERVYHSNERGDMRGGVGPAILQKTLAKPAEWMTAGDVTARTFLMDSGFSEPEARTATMTSEPASGFGKGESNMRKTKGPHGNQSILTRVFLPFFRTQVNQWEQGAMRLPLAGPLVRAHLRQAPQSFRVTAAQNALSVTSFGLGYQIGKHSNKETQSRWMKFVNNFFGVYGTTASAGFLAGVASHKYNDLTSQLTSATVQLLKNGTPLPTADPIIDTVMAIRSAAVDHKLKLPYGLIPPFLSSREQLSIPTLLRGERPEKMLDGRARVTEDEWSLLAPFVKNPKLKKPIKPAGLQKVDQINERLRQIRKKQGIGGLLNK